MITANEADTLARETIAGYLNACKLESPDDAANALMKLASLAGVTMCMVVGQDEAVQRMEATAAHVAKPEFAGPWHMEKLQ